ncbi:MAG: hypothetical protein M0Q41_01385 [Bacteroidales bacterium]|nr:hypothetical protein [Bacteroidales bacterium]MDD3702563.1 hypothetical protein [Bacteroidales bacterium]
MKKFISILLILMGFVLYNPDVVAQGPPPPPPNHGQSGNQPAGGGAPIGSGLGILMILGAAYGGAKIYQAVKNREKLEE